MADAPAPVPAADDALAEALRAGREAECAPGTGGEDEIAADDAGGSAMAERIARGAAPEPNRRP